MSHHQGDAKKIEKLAKINAFQVTLFAGFLSARATRWSRSLLDHMMILYGCGISDSDQHSHRQPPALVLVEERDG